MTLRNWIAEKLCPQPFADQRAYQRMKAEAADAYHWLGGFPDARDALRWILDNDRNSRRAIGEPAVGSLPSRIDQFREMLDRRNLGPSPASKSPDGWGEPVQPLHDAGKDAWPQINNPSPFTIVEDAESCPICAEPFKPNDICASDITEGTCHAACLEGTPVVDLDTGDELLDGKVDTYPYSEVMDPAPQTKLEPHAALTYDYLGCEHMSRDVANIERIAAAGSMGPTEVVYLYAGIKP